METTSETALTELAANVVSAYVSNNTVAHQDLPALIGEVHQALVSATSPVSAPEPERREPAVPIKKSITPDYIICLEDGKRFKSLKRHLRTAYGLTPDEYRRKWGLPSDYPMVAANYSQSRSALAQAFGLGQRRAQEAQPEASPPSAPAEETRKPKRSRKSAPDQAETVPTEAAADTVVPLEPKSRRSKKAA